MNFFKRLFGGGKKSGDTDKAACIACEETNLEILAADAYRCTSCGYEGGDGYAAYLAGKKREKFTGYSRAELLDKTIEGLENARLSLTAVVDIQQDNSALSSDTVSDSVSTGNWTFTVSAPNPIGGSAMSQMEREEQERIRQKREMELAKARGEVVGLRPCLEVLGDKGIDCTDHLERLSTIEAKEECTAQEIADFLRPAGQQLSSQREKQE